INVGIIALALNFAVLILVSLVTRLAAAGALAISARARHTAALYGDRIVIHGSLSAARITSFAASLRPQHAAKQRPRRKKRRARDGCYQGNSRRLQVVQKGLCCRYQEASPYAPLQSRLVVSWLRCSCSRCHQRMGGADADADADENVPFGSARRDCLK